MFVKIVGFIKKRVTTRTPETLEERINIVCMNDMIAKPQYLTVLSNLPILRRASSPTYSPSWISKSYIKMFF